MYIGAFYIGGTKTIIALADETGKIYARKQFATQTANCYEHLDKCTEIFFEFLKDFNISKDQVYGIGVNLPGIVDNKTGTLIRAVYAGWEMLDIGPYLSKKLEIQKIICENDVNSCAIGELRFGLGKKYRSFAWITVSTGVGGAIVCDSNLIRGSHGYAGEFGHLKVEYEKPEKCPCGEYGCLEAHGSGTAITREINKFIETDKNFAENFMNIEKKSIGAVCAELARKDNVTAKSIYEKAGHYLGRGIAYYLNLLDPEVIILGGGVSSAIDILEPGIKDALEKYTFNLMKKTPVLATALGYDAALMGAIAIVIDNAEKR